MPIRTFNDATEKEIVELYRTGIATVELGQRYGCHQATIARIVRKHGAGRGKGFGRSPVFTRQHGPRILELWERGLSVNEIANELGLDPVPVKKVLVRFGVVVVRRPRSGERHAGWNGGRFVNDRGYVEVLAKDPRFASMRGSDGYTPEHRLVMARALGRPLKSHETVHHIDGNRQNNALSNLELRQGKHGNGVRFVCRDCGSHNVEAIQLEKN